MARVESLEPLKANTRPLAKINHLIFSALQRVQ